MLSAPTVRSIQWLLITYKLQATCYRKSIVICLYIAISYVRGKTNKLCSISHLDYKMTLPGSNFYQKILVPISEFFLLYSRSNFKSGLSCYCVYNSTDSIFAIQNNIDCLVVGKTVNNSPFPFSAHIYCLLTICHWRKEREKNKIGGKTRTNT